MKNLYLVRHAKSSWEYDVIDHERPLNDRGMNDAKLIGKELSSYISDIDIVLCSDAIRTTQTAAILFKEFKISEEQLEFKHELYDFEGRMVIDVIQQCSDKVDNLMIIGHNHALTSLANMYGNQRIDNVPTAGVVGIQFHQDSWKDITEGKTIFTVYPKALR